MNSAAASRLDPGRRRELSRCAPSLGHALALLLAASTACRAGGLPAASASAAGAVPARPFRALMATDWGVTLDLAGVYGSHFAAWRAARIDTIYVVADLAVGPADRYSRHHIGFGRTRQAPTELLLANLRTIDQAGFRIILVAGNEPTVRAGYSHRLGAHGASPAGDGERLRPPDCYTPEKRASEVEFYRAIFRELPGVIDAIVIYLEPSVREAVPFQRDLARALREELAWDGPLYANGYGGGAWYTGEFDVRSAPSLSWDRWQARHRSVALVNCDGMDTTAANAARRLPWITARPGPDGWILWFDAYRGIGGPSVLAPWLWHHFAVPRW